MIDSFRELFATFERLDPGAACWQFIQQYHPAIWREHCQAILADDLASTARTFKSMVEMWREAQQVAQGALF